MAGPIVNPEDCVANLKPGVPLIDIFPSVYSAFNCLRPLLKKNPALVLKYFKDYVTQYSLNDNDVHLSEGRIRQYYMDLKIHNYSTDMVFKYHTGACDCKSYKTIYTKEKTLCNLLTTYGRTLLVCEFFFPTESDAKEAFFTLKNHLTYEQFESSFNFELLNLNSHDMFTINHWIKSRYKPEVEIMPLLEPVLYVDQIALRDQDDNFDIYENSDSDQGEYYTTVAQQHPVAITTGDILREHGTLKFETREPYTVLLLKSAVEKFYVGALEYRYIGPNPFKTFTTLSKLLTLEMMSRISRRLRRNTLEWVYFVQMYENMDKSLLPNTKRHEVGNKYYHAIQDNKSLIYRHINLKLYTFESMIEKISKIEDVVFVYNPDDSVDLYTPTNHTDIVACHKIQYERMRNDLGNTCVIGNEVELYMDEEVYSGFLDDVE